MDNQTPAPSANPTIQEASAAAVESYNNPAPAETPVASTPQPQAEPTQESFTKFDPNAITDPNLQAAYKQMQADYTVKMKQLSEKESQYAKYNDMLPIIDEMLNTKPGETKAPTFKDAVMTRVTTQLQEAGYDDNAINFAKMIGEQILGAQEEKEQATQQEQATKQFQAKLTADITESGKIDPRLTDQSLKYEYNGKTMTFGDIVERLVAATPNWHQDVAGATRDAIAAVDAMLNTAKTAGKQELSQQAREKSGKFAPVNTSPQSAVETDKQMSLREAIEAARQAGA